MARFRTAQNTFQAGQLDPLLTSRTDLGAYKDGVETSTNWWHLAQGGVMKRQGFKYLADIGWAARIIPWTFSSDEMYVLVLYAGVVKAYSTTGTLIDTTSSCPWTADNIYEITYAQYGDTMFFAHEDFAIQEYIRNSATDFSIRNFHFQTNDTGECNMDNSAGTDDAETVLCPFYKFNDWNITLTPSATSGTGVTLTASESIFAAGHVGTRFGLTDDPANKYHQVEVTGYTSGTQVTITVRETLDSTNATRHWKEQVFSDVRGYPQAVSIFDDRLYLAGSTARPSGIMASKIGEYYSFDLDNASADDAIDVSLGSDRVDEIRYMMQGRNLQFFTDSGEYYLRVESTGGISPTNIGFKRQTSFGIKKIRPQQLDGATYFIQRSGTVAREYIYDDVQDGYTSNAISFLTDVINSPQDTGIIQGTTEQPEQFWLLTNTDGSVAAFHTMRSDKVQGWSKWTTHGDSDSATDKPFGFGSITSVVNEVFAIVHREINGSSKVYLEKMDLDDSKPLDSYVDGVIYQHSTPLVKGGSQTGNSLLADGISPSFSEGDEFTIAGVSGTYVISGVSTLATGEQTLNLTTNLASSPADNAAITVTKGHIWTVGTHLTSEAGVSVISGNEYLGDFTVDVNDLITLDVPVDSMTAGFKYDSVLKTMPVDVAIQGQPLTARYKRIVRCIIDVQDAIDVDVNGKDLIVRTVTGTLSGGGLPRTAVNGKQEFYLTGYSQDAQVTLTSDVPTPLKIRGIVLEIDY